MKIDKLNLDGKKDSIEVLDKIMILMLSIKYNHQKIVMMSTITIEQHWVN